MWVPKKVVERIQAGLKKFCPILQSLRDRDVSEADTVTAVKDILSEIFGYDKWSEITGEHAIRGTYCDLAIKLDGKLALLIEVKAIGSDLKDNHIRQAIDYAANQGVEWVMLTNGVTWVLYHVLFKKPIDKEEVASINLLTSTPKLDAEQQKLFLFTKEGVQKNALAEYRDRKDATSHYMLATIILNSGSILNSICREVKQVSDITVDRGAIEKVLREQVIKREALEGEQSAEALQRYKKRIAKAKKSLPKPESTVESVCENGEPDEVSVAEEMVAADPAPEV